MISSMRRVRRTHSPRKRSLSLTILCTALLGAAPTFAVPSITQTRINLSSHALTRFKSSDSLKDLHSAVEFLDGTIDTTSLTPNNFIATRRALVEAWAAALKPIEESYDPTFDPKDPANVQYVCVAPPHIIGAEPCMSPDSIKDSKIRAAYIASINENEAKIRRWGHYLDVSQLDAHAMSSLEAALRLLNSIAPQGVGPDFVALDDLIRRAGLSDARRTKIDAMFYARSGP